jgi:energy-converting hydrogenase Eha subunit C
MQQYGPASAFIDFVVGTNETFSDALIFDPPEWGWGCTGATGCTGPAPWTLAPNWEMSIKGNRQQTSALITLTTGAGQIIVQDPVNRIISFNVPDTVLNAALVPGNYVFDLVMSDNSTPPIRTQMAHGGFRFSLGVTGET